MCLNSAQINNTSSYSLAADQQPVASDVMFELREVRMRGGPPVSSVTV